MVAGVTVWELCRLLLKILLSAQGPKIWRVRGVVLPAPDHPEWKPSRYEGYTGLQLGNIWTGYGGSCVQHIIAAGHVKMQGHSATVYAKKVATAYAQRLADQAG